MIKILVAALFVFIATSIDEIPILFILYTRKENKMRASEVTAGYYLGTILLIALGLLGARGLDLIPEKGIVGLTGLIPLVMGVKILFTGEDEDSEEALVKGGKTGSALLQVTLIALALGADDLGVYMPFFTTIGWFGMGLIFLLYMICTGALCLISHTLTRIDYLQEKIEKYERFLVGAVFLFIGISVIVENQTIPWILDLIHI